MIQATVVDTWAATVPGPWPSRRIRSIRSMAGESFTIISTGRSYRFSRWNHKPDFHETTRLFSLAYATCSAKGFRTGNPPGHDPAG